MINNTINISVDYQEMGVKPSPRQTTLTTYILDKRTIEESVIKPRPAVIICPGGAYSFTSPREGEPLAMKYCAAGFHSFVLDYSVYPSSWPAAICELSKAIAYVRKISGEYNIDPNKIFVCGSSAGGHLAASIGVHWNHPDVVKCSGVSNSENKPNGIILCYPVITGDPNYWHQGSIENFIGGKSELEPLAHLENYVSSDTPQTFIWHTFSDAAVPVKNSLLFANALEKHNVKFELHIYPDGPHGLSLADASVAPNSDYVVPAVQNWIDMSIRWINEYTE